MSKSNSFENEVLLHVFNNSDIALIGDAGGLRGSVTAGSLYVALHTATPDEAGTQQTNEATYTGYARVGVARSAGGWTVTNDLATNAAAITYAICTAGSNTITHFSIGVAASGVSKILYYGALTASLAVSAGITPEFAAGDLDVYEA